MHETFFAFVVLALTQIQSCSMGIFCLKHFFAKALCMVTKHVMMETMMETKRERCPL